MFLVVLVASILVQACCIANGTAHVPNSARLLTGVSVRELGSSGHCENLIKPADESTSACLWTAGCRAEGCDHVCVADVNQLSAAIALENAAWSERYYDMCPELATWVGIALARNVRRRLLSFQELSGSAVGSKARRGRMLTQADGPVSGSGAEDQAPTAPGGENESGSDGYEGDGIDYMDYADYQQEGHGQGTGDYEYEERELNGLVCPTKDTIDTASAGLRQIASIFHDALGKVKFGMNTTVLYTLDGLSYEMYVNQMRSILPYLEDPTLLSKYISDNCVTDQLDVEEFRFYRHHYSGFIDLTNSETIQTCRDNFNAFEAIFNGLSMIDSACGDPLSGCYPFAVDRVVPTSAECSNALASAFGVDVGPLARAQAAIEAVDTQCRTLTEQRACLHAPLLRFKKQVDSNYTSWPFLGNTDASLAVFPPADGGNSPSASGQESATPVAASILPARASGAAPEMAESHDSYQDYFGEHKGGAADYSSTDYNDYSSPAESTEQTTSSPLDSFPAAAASSAGVTDSQDWDHGAPEAASGSNSENAFLSSTGAWTVLAVVIGIAAVGALLAYLARWNRKQISGESGDYQLCLADRGHVRAVEQEGHTAHPLMSADELRTGRQGSRLDEC